MPSRQLARLTLAALGVAALLAGPAAAQGFTPSQKEEIGRIVREYLVQNPEVLSEAIGELEKRQAEAQKTAQTSALKENREALLRSPHGYLVGNPNGDITLVEFFDYNCGYCKVALGDLQTLIKSDTRLRVVLKDLPVLGPDSLEASRVALAAKQQLSGDKLLDYHARLLSTRGRVNGERANAVAREMGLDMARLARDLDGPAVKAALEESRHLGEQLGLNGTPAFVIGEEVISGAVGLNALRQAIAGVRQCGHLVC